MSMHGSLITAAINYIDCTEEEWVADKNWHDRVWDLRGSIKAILEHGDLLERDPFLLDELLNAFLVWNLDNKR